MPSKSPYEQYVLAHCNGRFQIEHKDHYANITADLIRSLRADYDHEDGLWVLERVLLEVERRRLRAKTGLKKYELTEYAKWLESVILTMSEQASTPPAPARTSWLERVIGQ